MNNKRIAVLLIEDNPGDARFIREILAEAKDASFHATVADRLQAGLDCLATDEIDVVLLDLSLPDSHGLDSLITVLGRAPQVPIIVLTGFADEQLAVTAVREGAQDYLVKGETDPHLLWRSIRYAIERKQTQVALQHLSHQFKLILNAAGEGIYGLDLNGRTTLINPAAATMIGWDMEDLIGKPQHDILHHTRSDGTPYPRDHCPIYAAFKDGTIHHVDSEVFWRKDGTSFPVEYISTPIRDEREEITGAVVVFKDITERKRAEQELRETRQYLARLIESSSDPIIATDKDGNVVLFNEGAEVMLGYERAEVLGQHVTIIYESRERAKQVMRQMRHGGGSVAGFETVLRAKDRSLIPVLISASVLYDADRQETGTVGFNKDLRERKRAEKALEAAKEYAEGLINSSLDMIISTDMNRNIVEFNRSAQETFGYGKEEVLGVSTEILYADPSEGARVHTALITEGRFAGEVTNKRKNGQTFRSFLSGSAIHDAHGAFVGAMGISRDITEQKQAEEAIRESNRRLEETLGELKVTQQRVLQQERLRALGQMASGIAHDFNNALSPILGYSELLLDRPEQLEDHQKVTRYLQMINTGAKDAASVVRRLREFYRHREEDEVFLSVNLNDLIEQVVLLTQPKWKDQASANGITIHAETDLQNVPRVSGNDAELREVLTNLIFNAVDAMPEGGTLTVRTRPDGGQVLLEVSDTGTGMTEEVRQRCLDPFFTTKRERGTGLGLAMVYGIIQRHHGTLAIESQPDQGTTFSIRFQVHTEQEPEQQLQDTEGPSRRLRILAVDDEAPVREVVAAYLTGDGHTVEMASSGVEALQKFLAHWFDVVITDQGMLEMSGDQLAASIKQIARDKPVILLTGFGDLISASGLKPAGVDIIVSKPVTLAALRQALAKVAADQ